MSVIFELGLSLVHSKGSYSALNLVVHRDIALNINTNTTVFLACAHVKNKLYGQMRVPVLM